MVALYLRCPLYLHVIVLNWLSRTTTLLLPLCHEGCDTGGHPNVVQFETSDTRNGIRSRDSSVGIATGYWLDDQGEQEFESR
jgi:hypothetical protein